MSGTSLLLGMSGNIQAKLDTNENPPNFILILSDDQGWTGTSGLIDPQSKFSASDYIETPNIERLLKKGMSFTDAYAPAAICSPTRYSIQFGKTPARLLKTDNYGPSSESLERIKNSTSIAQMLKESGLDYKTAHLGKWHIKPSPEDLGYDVSDGSTDNPDGNGKDIPDDDPKKIFSLTRRANEFMEQQVREKKPFYLQISHYAVHLRLMSLAKTLKKYEGKTRGKWHNQAEFAACTQDLDTGIGMILDKVKELGIENNTYILFTSDNGALAIQPIMQKVNMPLRRGKFCFFEGGIKVPFVVCGPGIKSGSYCSEPIIGYDILPTIHELSQSSKSVPSSLDGGSLVTVLKNKGQGKVKRAFDGLYFHCVRGEKWAATRLQSAIRLGEYKLIKNYYNNDELLLFNIEKDPGETNNLAQQMPDKLKELHNKLNDYLKKVKAEQVTLTKEQLEEIKNAEKMVGTKGWGNRPGMPTEYPVDSSK